MVDAAVRIKPAAAESKARTLKPGREENLVLAGHRRNDWVLTAPSGCERSDLTQQAFWTYLSDKLHSRDTVEVSPPDKSWWCRIQIRSCGPGQPVVVRELDYDTQPEPSLTMRLALPEGHYVFFDEDRRLYYGMRRKKVDEAGEDHNLTGGWPTEADAIAALMKHATIRQA